MVEESARTIADYKQMRTGFPGVLEQWIPDTKGPIICFILKSDQKLQSFWRTAYPPLYPVATSKGPRAVFRADGVPTLYVRLY